MNFKKTRIIFAGTPDFSVTALNALVAANKDYEIVAVYTQPDRPRGRGNKLMPSAVKQAALLHNLPIFQPQNFKQLDDQKILQELQADLMIVVAYGLILPNIILNAPRLGCINIHASLLPRWRGAAPIQRAILAGDKTTGVCIMQMDKGLDTGAVFASEALPILKTYTSSILFAELAKIGAQLLIKTLPNILAQKIIPKIQSETGITYAHKIEKSESPIKWDQTALEIQQHIMGFNLGATCRLTRSNNNLNVDLNGDLNDNLSTCLNSETLKIWQAISIDNQLTQTLNELTLSHLLLTGNLVVLQKRLFVKTIDAWLEILELQQAGKKRLQSQQFILNMPKQSWILS
ncbi:L-methionyl-tRNA(fMet) N-formyltransferase [Gammaproteobacteria bacterium]|nr:L-methionyl-tRNA(fMet) N-formyltransferase [Gammaproteobacteria bacterium]